MRVELLSAPGCPHVAAAKTTVSECLTTLGMHLLIIERVGSYPSPTVLINGVDVMRPDDATPDGDACRLDLPTAQRILDTLRKESR